VPAHLEKAWENSASENYKHQNNHKKWLYKASFCSAITRASPLWHCDVKYSISTFRVICFLYLLDNIGKLITKFIDGYKIFQLQLIFF